MVIEGDKIYLGDDPKCSAYQFAILYLTRELNIASELLSQCGDPQMELSQILVDEGYRAAIRGKIVGDGLDALLLSRELDWQGIMVSDAYEEIHTRKAVESGQNGRIEKREIITPEEFAAVQAIIMK